MTKASKERKESQGSKEAKECLEKLANLERQAHADHVDLEEHPDPLDFLELSVDRDQLEPGDHQDLPAWLAWLEK